jgi:hypothetical protein
MRQTSCASHLIHALGGLFSDATRFIVWGLRSRAALRAENLFLRKQLALYIERKTKPRRADDATRLALVLLSRLFAWRDALVVVKPETLIGWHRKGFGSSGAGNRNLEVAQEFLLISGNSLPILPRAIRPGARSASPQSCCSDWGSGSRPVP